VVGSATGEAAAQFGAAWRRVGAASTSSAAEAQTAVVASATAVADSTAHKQFLT